MREQLAAEAAAYLATVDLFRQLCPGTIATNSAGLPEKVAAGPSWRSETDELGVLVPAYLVDRDPGDEAI